MIDDRAAEIAELLGRLIRIPSHPGIPRQEEAVARELAGYLERHGLAPRLVEVRPGRPNLLCTVGADPDRKAPGAAGPHLVLCGHTDTVPPSAGDAGTGLSGELRDGRVLGRGSVDMKGALAAMAVALVELAGAPELAGAVTLAAVMDEEMEGLGIEHLIDSGFSADGAIVGEPTSNRLGLGHKGLEWLVVEIVGRSAHGSTPHAGINAIVAASRFVELVESRLQPELARRAHPLLGPPTLNFGTVEGGEQPSTVAGRCRLALDRRSVPGESYDSMVGELEALLAEVAASMPGLESRVARFPGGTGAYERLPFVTPVESALARAVAAACQAVTGTEPEPGAFPAWTDGGMLAGPAGIPTLILGPGDLALAHSPREAVALEEVVAAARIYTESARRFCAPEAGREAQ